MDDLISRQAAIDDMQKFIDSMDKDSPAYKSMSIAFDRCIIELKKLPSVEPQRKTGEWIRNDNGTYSCSVCQSWIPEQQHCYARYCLYCGADMRGEIE